MYFVFRIGGVNIKNYLEALNQLKDGSISELTIKANEFIDFQPILMNFSDRKLVIGEARRGGDIVYHFESNESGN